MMSTYLDLPAWKLVMPGFCIPVVLASLAFLTLISYLSVKRMLRGTAADALRPYTPKAVRKSAVESLPLWSRLSFGTRWNIRDILRHKSRSAMTLLGVFGCMLLLVGGLGMRDTMERFLSMLDRDISHYRTKLLLTESAMLPGGVGVLYILITALAREYELSLAIGWRTCIVSIALTLGVSLLVSRMVARKNKKIDMVEALKDAA